MALLSSASEPLQVVVIDDVCRFALHVWRYLSRCVGFGTGTVPNDGRGISAFWSGQAPEPLETPAADARIWWVNAGERTEGRNWESQLEAVLEAMGPAARRRFLIDVRGPYYTKEASEKASARDSFRSVVGLLAARGIDPLQEVLLVSSYHTAPCSFRETGGRPLRIHPKAPETLERLCPPGRGPSSPAAAAVETREPVHVLVTGAGFELKDTADDFRRLGTRLTNSILLEALADPFAPSGGMASAPGSFCCPARYADPALPSAQGLREAARSFDLDSYWDELLILELLERLNSQGGGGRPDKVAAIRREYDLREAFRRQFLADDWGFLGQALDALEVPGLAAWLTTNYTRFADRAIELAIAHAAPSVLRWRIVSTVSESDRLIQELLHETKRHRSTNAAPGEASRFLFKLHGDLAHLLTMAVAGHDKEVFSPLSLPISSLHSIYTAAERYLIRHLGKERESVPVFWHVVGHGLKDSLLVRLIRDVCRDTDPSRHRFLVVNPSPGDPRSILVDELGGLVDPAAIRPLALRADEYMARLKGLAPDQLFGLFP